eukprot:933024_1
MFLLQYKPKLIYLSIDSIRYNTTNINNLSYQYLSDEFQEGYDAPQPTPTPAAISISINNINNINNQQIIIPANICQNISQNAQQHNIPYPANPNVGNFDEFLNYLKTSHNTQPQQSHTTLTTTPNS